MNVLLVILRFSKEEIVNPFIPLGSAYINGVLRSDGSFSVQACNLNYEDFGELEKKLETADVVLAGGTVKDWNKLTRLFSFAKTIKPDILTIGGGAGYTASPIPFCDLTQPDYATIGEGEITVPELLHALAEGADVRKIQGVVYKKDGAYHYTGDRPLIRDLDTIPFPSYEGLGIEEYFGQQRNIRRRKMQDKNFFLLKYNESEACREIPMLLSRSCPFQCKFCFHSVGNRYRIRSMDNFFQELDHLISKHHINGIHLIDELFGLREDVIAEFCDRIEAYHIGWFAEIRVETASAALLKRMKQAGCQNIQFGIENINDEVLKNMNKKITREMIENALRNSYDAGMTVSGNILIGAENDTLERFLENFDWWNRNRKYLIHLIQIEQYTGTAYFKNCLKRGIIRDEQDYIRRGMPRVNMSEMSDFEWHKMQRMMELSRRNKAFQGPLAAKKHIGRNGVLLEAKCAHCGETYSIETTRESWEEEQIFNSYCSHCGRFNSVDRRDNRNYFQYLLMQQWISNETNGVRCEQWLSENGFHSVALVWNTPFAQVIYERLAEAGVFEIDCVTDDIPEVKAIYPNLEVVQRESLPQRAVDCILVCEASEFVAVRQQLRELGCKGEVVSSADMIFCHRFYLTDREKEKPLEKEYVRTHL